jgi:hypothetical protein
VTVITDAGERWNVAANFSHGVVDASNGREDDQNVIPMRKGKQLRRPNNAMDSNAVCSPLRLHMARVIANVDMA